MKFLLATKQYMTQIFDENGRVHPATVLSAGPVTVTQVKRADGKDGYGAVQVGFGSRREARVNRAVRPKGLHAHFREFRGEGEYSVGTVLDASQFNAGDMVTVSATSKGKGFQGVVKRHGFHGGPRTHGQKHSEREPGSIGSGGVQRVLKGTRMAGRMGSERVTVKNLQVLHCNATEHILVVEGAVPGRRGTLVEVRGV